VEGKEKDGSRRGSAFEREPTFGSVILGERVSVEDGVRFEVSEAWSKGEEGDCEISMHFLME